MNAYSTRRPRSFDWARAFLVSILVHILVVLLWVTALVLEFFLTQPVEFVDEPPLPQESIRELTFEMAEMLQAAEVTEPEPPQKSFLSTRKSQETTEQIESERYFGERSTLAASETAGDETGLAVPTQEGRDPRTPNELELADSQFADGETDGAPGTPGQPVEESMPETESKPTETAEEAEPSEEKAEEKVNESVALETPLYQPTAEERMQMAQQRAAKLLELEQSIPMPAKEEQPEPVEEPAIEEAIPESKKEVRPTTFSGAPRGDGGIESGFEREATKTRVRGTIRRVGENSVDVEDSIKGRFLADVNRQIERAWQRECILRREHILPGVLSVTFILDESGSVTGFRFDSRIAGGAIQEGFTMRAVQKADIPEMPKEMKAELDGSPLEMTLTFFF